MRYTFNNRYFSDTYEGLPVDGYTAWLERMADHPNIEVRLDTDFSGLRSGPASGTCRWCTPGRSTRTSTTPRATWAGAPSTSTWRSSATGDFQGTPVMNYADEDVPFTRIHEFRHFHPERDWYPKDKTVIMREYSRFAEPRRRAVLPDQHRARTGRGCWPTGRWPTREPGVLFGGRLGTYKYLDMHMAIGSALSMYDNRLRPFFADRAPLTGRGGQDMS